MKHFKKCPTKYLIEGVALYISIISVRQNREGEIKNENNQSAKNQYPNHQSFK